jgi:hypothetical protein
LSGVRPLEDDILPHSVAGHLRQIKRFATKTTFSRVLHPVDTLSRDRRGSPRLLESDTRGGRLW